MVPGSEHSSIVRSRYGFANRDDLVFLFLVILGPRAEDLPPTFLFDTHTQPQ
jgi:hypothetical protein